VTATDGEDTEDATIRVEDADAVTVLLTAATDDCEREGPGILAFATDPGETVELVAADR